MILYLKKEKEIIGFAYFILDEKIARLLYVGMNYSSKNKYFTYFNIFLNNNWQLEHIMNDFDKLKQKVENFNISLTDSQIEQFKEYLNLLGEYNAYTNIVSSSEIENTVMKHFLDSLAIGLAGLLFIAYLVFCELCILKSMHWFFHFKISPKK